MTLEYLRSVFWALASKAGRDVNAEGWATMADRMLDGKQVEDVFAVRLASEALRYLAIDEVRFAAFRAWLLDAGGEMPVGVSREVTERLTPDLLSGARETYVAAMIREGYQ